MMTDEQKALNQEIVLPLEIPIIITIKNDSPSIELRKSTTEINLLKQIISCAFHQRPMIFLPVFSNKLKSLNSLIDKGIIYRNPEDNQFYFNI